MLGSFRRLPSSSIPALTRKRRGRALALLAALSGVTLLAGGALAAVADGSPKRHPGATVRLGTRLTVTVPGRRGARSYRIRSRAPSRAALHARAKTSLGVLGSPRQLSASRSNRCLTTPSPS